MQNKVLVRKGNSKNITILSISILSSFSRFSEHKEKEQTKKSVSIPFTLYNIF